MCELVKREPGALNNRIDLDGIGTKIYDVIYLPFGTIVADGVRHPVICRHSWRGPWEALPEPGPGEMIEVPDGSTLALGIIVDGEAKKDFTEDEWDRRTILPV